MNAPIPKGAQAVMASRRDSVDALDMFPTPPWATRAFVHEVLFLREMADEQMTVWEPAAGLGHMSDVLAEAFAQVHSSDVHDYGRGFALGSFVGEGADIAQAPTIGADWIITNPPFNLAVAFAERATMTAKRGTALLVRAVWAEGAERYRRLFRDLPPTHIAQYCDRVAMTKGKWDPHASTATAYAWFVWHHDRKVGEDTRFVWIQPGAKARHTRPDDAARFSCRVVP
jgi:hypothetical protein